MAALGKIRRWGVVLACIIGFGLFAFIAEELFRSCDATKNQQRQTVGKVLGESVSVQDFQKLVDEYQQVIKMQQGVENLNDDQLNQVKDMVWNTFVQSKLIENEAEKLGLTVTDEEMQNIMRQGNDPLLLQSPFVNRQTGRFDVNALQKFLADYKAQQASPNQAAEQYDALYKYWTFIEKTLRQQTLAQKYQTLLAQCLLSNPVEAKAAFNEQNEQSQVQLASVAYSTIDDSKVKPESSELKAKYAEMKEQFKQYVESRDIKYVDVEVVPSQSDRKALNKQFAEYQQQLAAAADPTDVVRKSTSLVQYLGLPQTKDAFPTDIAAKLDSMAVGQTTAPIENASDNTLNIIKLVAKQQSPDSIQYRQIQVGGETPEAAHKTADSIYTALAGGADFEVIAKKYGQTGDKTWLTSAQYQGAQSLDTDTKKYLETLTTAGVGETKNVEISQGNIILQVLDRKNMVTKYTAAVIKKSIEFSKDTYSAAFNKFSSFVSANQTPDAIEKNAAKNGYVVREATDITTAQHNIAGIRGTRDAMKWLFEAKEGTVSPMYECGDNNHLLVVICNKINPIGYRTLADPQVREMVNAEVVKDKKAAQIEEQLKGVNSIAAAQKKGAKVSEVNQITFAAPVFVTATGSSEPALSGAVAATAKGKFSKKPVKGNAGVYVFQVVNKTKGTGKFDDKTQEAGLRQRAIQYAGNFMNELYIKANVVDNRYLFF